MSGERIEALLGELRGCAEPAVMARVEELVEQLVSLHGRGSAGWSRFSGKRMPSMSPSGEDLAADPLVSALLELHGLHPDEAAARIEQALEHVRPYLERVRGVFPFWASTARASPTSA